MDAPEHPTAESQEQFARQIPLGYFGDPSDMAYLVARVGEGTLARRGPPRVEHPGATPHRLAVAA